MPYYRDEAIVLRTQKLGEADRIITLLTRSHGRVRAVAKGVRRTSSRFGARLEPFSHVDVQLAEARSLDVVTQAAVLTLVSSALVRGLAPIYPLPDEPLSDPLSQAMALTAIVIGMAVTALLLTLVLRVTGAFGTRAVDELAEEEAELDAKLERERGEAHDDEEDAAS